MRRRGRPPADGTTMSARTAILDAARGLFGERGYDRATIRAIAERAGVDPALVHHYFGTKEELLVSVLEVPIDVDSIGAAIRSVDRDHVGEAVVRFFLDMASDPSRRSRMVAMVRAAMSSEVAARLMRGFVSRVLVAQLSSALPDVPDIDVRAELTASHLVGLGIVRYVVAVEPLASATDEVVVAAVGPTVQRYLVGDLSAS